MTVITKENIAYIVSEMRALNRPLTVAEAQAQVAACGFEGAEAHAIVLRVLGLIAAQEFAAAQAKRRRK